MKKIILAALAASAMATPAFAQSTTNVSSANSLVFGIDADVGVICGVYSTRTQPIPIEFGQLADVAEGTEVSVSGGQAAYRCNAPAGFSRTVTSANSGFLFRTGTSGGNANQIAYTMQHGGGSGLGFSAQQVTAPITANFNGSTAFLAGQGGSVTFRVNGVFNNNSNVSGAPGTTVFAGDYTDTVTIAVTAR